MKNLLNRTAGIWEGTDAIVANDANSMSNDDLLKKLMSEYLDFQLDLNKSIDNLISGIWPEDLKVWQTEKPETAGDSYNTLQFSSTSIANSEIIETTIKKDIENMLVIASKNTSASAIVASISNYHIGTTFKAWENLEENLDSSMMQLALLYVSKILDRNGESDKSIIVLGALSKINKELSPELYKEVLG